MGSHLQPGLFLDFPQNFGREFDFSVNQFAAAGADGVVVPFLIAVVARGGVAEGELAQLALLDPPAQRKTQSIP